MDDGLRDADTLGDGPDRQALRAQLLAPGALLLGETGRTPPGAALGLDALASAGDELVDGQTSILAAQAMTARITWAAGPSRAKPSLTDTSSTP